MSIHLPKQPQRSTTPDDSPPPTHSAYEQIRELWKQSSENSSISLREFVASSDPALPIDYDHLVQLLGDGQFDQSPFGAWAFEEAAHLLSQIPPDDCAGHNTEYSHAVKYLFQGSCARAIPHRSLLDEPHSLALAEQLIDTSVRFCERSHSLGTALVSIRGIIASNMRAWARANDVSEFLFHPKSFASPEFLALVEHARLQSSQRSPSTRTSPGCNLINDPYALCLYFCASHTPEEFLRWAVTNHMVLPLSELHEAIQAALMKTGCPASPQSAGSTPRSATQQSGRLHCELTFRPGIYVDVFGTLIQHDGNPNLRLITLVRDLMQQNPHREVFLISDSEDDELASALKPVGEPLPPLIHKEELRDTELEVLIDNCEPEPQGLHARTYLEPSKAIDVAARLLEPQGMALVS